MTIRKIDRIRPESEMPQVFWDNRYNWALLYLSLWAEILRTRDEGRAGSKWEQLVYEGVLAIKRGEASELYVAIENMAAFQKVTLKTLHPDI